MKNSVLFFTLSTIAITAVGCGSLSDKPHWSKPDLSRLLPSGPPAKAVAAWEPAIRHDGTDMPKRGFGGRVYFYDRDGKKPIKIDGNVIVYAFDEDGRQPDDNVPSRSYYFDKKDVKKLHSKSRLGSSYNFWVPWDAEGIEGKARKVALIVRYVPEVGSSVISSQATVYLPGKKDQTEMMAKSEWEAGQKQKEAIQQVAYQTGKKTNPIEARLIESNENRPATMQTSTISVPSNFAQTFQQALKSSPNPQTTETFTLPSEILPVNYLDERQNQSTQKPDESKTTTARKQERFDRDRFVIGRK